MLKDEELVEKVKNGDIDAFEKIIEAYESKVFGVIYHMINDKNEVEDIAQEVFIKVYKNLHKFQGNSSLYTWIYRITVNLCLDVIKSKKKVIYLDDTIKTEDGEIDRELPSNEKTGEEIYEEKELKDIMRKCISKLPEKQRAMVILRDIKGLSYEEISEITNIKLGTVKSQINRARIKLKELLEADGTLMEYVESNS